MLVSKLAWTRWQQPAGWTPGPSFSLVSVSHLRVLIGWWQWLGLVSIGQTFVWYIFSFPSRLRCCSNTAAVQSSPNLNNSMIHYQSKLLWSEIPVRQNAIVLQKCWWLNLLNQSKFMWDHSLIDCLIRPHWARARWCRAAGSCSRSWGWTRAPSVASWPVCQGSGIWNGEIRVRVHVTLSTSRHRTWSGCRGWCRDMKGRIRCKSCQTRREATGERSSQH